MALFNLRLTDALQRQLHTEAERRGISRSDLARDALAAYLTPQTQPEIAQLEADDDWTEFGAAVTSAHRTILTSLIDQLDDTTWEKAIEPIYDKFREMTVASSRAYQNPTICIADYSKPGPPYEPRVEAILAFAADDQHTISVSLEQLLFEYGWHAGMDALAEVPAIYERAKTRLDAGEPDPTDDQCRDARIWPLPKTPQHKPT
jgi:predicted transcriptional regulator